MAELGRGGILLGVGGVDAIDSGALEDDVGLDLHGAERAAGVGGEEGVARAGAHDHDVALFQQADGLGGAHRVGDAVDVKTGEQGGLLAFDAVHALRGALEAAEDVAAADDDADLHAGLGGLDDLVGVFIQSLRVDAILLAAHQGLAAEFQ